MAYTPRLKPYDHQLRGVEKCNGVPGFAYLAEMGCVDSRTEYLSPTGWHPIDEWERGPVAQFHPETGVTFVEPTAYLRKRADRFTRFTGPGVDQVLSLDHRILYRTQVAREVQPGSPPDNRWRETTTRETIGLHHGHVGEAVYPILPNDFGPDSVLDFTEDQISYVGLGEYERYDTADNMMYCFAVPSSYLLFRRNGCVFISGNSSN